MLKKISIDDGAKTVWEGKPGQTYYIILEREYVFHGFTDKPEKKINKDAINRMHLDTLSLIVPGGCVVMQKGDLIVYHYSHGADGFFANWVTFFTKKLAKRNIKLEIDHELINDKHHDLLIRKKTGSFWKIGTQSENFAKPDLYFCCMGIMDHVNIKHISKVVKVSEWKEPAGLSAWGISSDDLEQWFLEFMRTVYKETPVQE